MEAALVTRFFPLNRTNSLFAAVLTLCPAFTVKDSVRSITPKTSAPPPDCRTAYTELGMTLWTWEKVA